MEFARINACHRGEDRGRGDGPAGSGLDPQPTDIARCSTMPIASRDDLYWTIAEGGEPVGSARPPFGDALSEDEIGQWLSGTSDWGMETTEGEIDEILYDREPLSEFDDE